MYDFVIHGFSVVYMQHNMMCVYKYQLSFRHINNSGSSCNNDYDNNNNLVVVAVVAVVVVAVAAEGKLFCLRAQTDVSKLQKSIMNGNIFIHILTLLMSGIIFSLCI